MYNERSVFLTYVIQWALASPLFLVYIVGILVALLNVSKHRGPSILVLLALALLGLETLTAPVGSIYLVTYLQQQRAMPIAEVGYVMSIFHVVMLLLEAVGIALLLVAVFYHRPASAPAVPPPSSLPPPL